MPVPVPIISKPLAHPVFKPSQPGNNTGNAKPSVFQQLSHTLPISPIGPPPSFGTREEWINSLPSWRKLKPRRIWEDDARGGELIFSEGLMGIPNASVIKGAHAHARLPPICTLQYSSFTSVSPDTGFRQRCGEEADDEMSSDCSLMDQCHYDNESQWSASSPVVDGDDRVEMATGPQFGVAEDRPGWHRDDGVVFEDQVYEKGAFSPIYEDDSPQMVNGPDVASSPIGPTTPFGEFVDRAVAASQSYASFEVLHVATNLVHHEADYQFTDTTHGQYHQYPPYQDEVKEPPPASEPVVATTTTTISYKKLAEPLADWVATYVWKVCTTGMSLPSDLILPMSDASGQYSSAPPCRLAGLVHSVFLSTLLQPSAVLLALWYIVRLPVFFGAVGLGPEHVKELRFRAELLGSVPDTLETDAPFRLILLGCMLANKWLDDHTFSNKTWQSISQVPIESLNTLESLALDIFSHDLSTPPRAWSQWLTHLVAYHQSLSSSSHPQPISRPSTNPHLIVRKALEDIMHAPASIDSSIPEPVFLGLEERRTEKLGIGESSAECVDVYEIDLDKDGPLREEYLPRRRVSGAGSIRSAKSRDTPDSKISVDQGRDREKRDSRAAAVEKVLPPPAKWSPEADEPIFRENGRTSGQYVAVQPPLAFAVPLPPYQQDVRYQSWPATATFVPVNHHLTTSFAYDPVAIQQTLPAYPYVAVTNQSHSRSHSLSRDLENCPSGNHSRSYSQSVFDYRCSGIPMTTNEGVLPGQHDVQWDSAARYGCAAPYRQPFGPHPNVNYQSTWLRA